MAYGLLSMIMHMEDVSRREKMENGMLTRVRLSVNVFGHPAIAIGYFRIFVVYMYVANYLQSTPLSLSLSDLATNPIRFGKLWVLVKVRVHVHVWVRVRAAHVLHGDRI
jgi:hypothetical protein